MLENNPDNLKRLAPPQRNRSLNRRRPGDRFEKINSYGIDGGKSQSSHARNLPCMEYREFGSINIQNENAPTGLIALDGCCTSEIAQLLDERWTAAMNVYNDPSFDQSEKPILYSGASGSSWGHLKLPHQMDFLTELRRAIHNGQSNPTPNASDHS